MLATGVQCTKSIGGIVEFAINRTEPILSIANKVFYETVHLMQSSYFLTVGVYETCMGLFSNETTLSDISKKIRSVFYRFLGWIKSIPERILSYNVIHGGLMLGTGVCELLLGLQQFECITLGATTPLIMGMSNTCFFLGNLVMLIHNVQLLQRFSCVPDNASNEEKAQARRLKLSAILSIVSALNYIVGMATILFGGPTALIIMFIALGLTFGGLKILYDWFYT